MRARVHSITETERNFRYFDVEISLHSGKTKTEKRENATRRCSVRKYSPNFSSNPKQQHSLM